LPRFSRAPAPDIYLREAYSRLGLSLRLDAVLVIQTGTIAAVAVVFARLPWRFASRHLAADLDRAAHRAFF